MPGQRWKRLTGLWRCHDRPSKPGTVVGCSRDAVTTWEPARVDHRTQRDSTRTDPRKPKTLTTATINLNTMRGKKKEVMMLMNNRNPDMMGLCVTCTGWGNWSCTEHYYLYQKGGEEARLPVAAVGTKEQPETLGYLKYKNERIIRPQEENHHPLRNLQEIRDSVPHGDDITTPGHLNRLEGQHRTSIENVLGAFSAGNRKRRWRNRWFMYTKSNVYHEYIP